MKLKAFILTASLWLTGLAAMAQVSIGGLSPLHVDGRQMKDQHGNTVVLHGVMDTPSMWFNGYFDENGNQHPYWTGGYDQTGTGKTNCLNYFEKQFTAITDTTQGAYCKIFRLHLDPAWTNGSEGTTTVDSREAVSDHGTEAYFGKYTPSKLTYWLPNLYFKIAKKAMEHGMYVIMRPPGVCPPNIYVGGSYQKYLLDVWDKVSKNDSIRKYSGQISLELANEPINVFMNDEWSSPKALHDFFQPIVDKIRENGYTGIILIPGTGYQSNYRDYATYPIEGYNIGYAVHVYSGWYGGMSDSNCNSETFIKNFGEAVPVVNTNPIVVTEVDWSPENKSGQIDHYNEFNQPVYKNYGTWATGSTSKWGKAYKAVLDHYGNISMTLTHPHDFFNIKKYLDTWNNRTKSGVLEPAFKEEMAANGLDVYEASSGACFQWYKEYAQKDYATKAYKRAWTADQGIGSLLSKPMFINPILNGDFPDPDVIRVDDTYYMVSTTMYHFPGATILKSKDLVNWEYCANPLETLVDNDAYNLLNGQNHYAQGMWASSLAYHDGKFYLYFPCSTWSSDAQFVLLTATDPEGQWEDTRVSVGYHDPGMLFDDGENGDGNLYVACGINDIWVNKVDPKTFKQIGDGVKGISKPDSGLEGCHMYHIGDYYYIYATYGGTERSQTIFRSTNPMGPYEEHAGRVFENQNIHQGALVQTQTGEWWTILFKDIYCTEGAVGRRPYLEPVKWVNGWPIIGNNGVDVSKGGSKYKKPNVGAFYPRTYLPTNDTFTGPKLGMQWQWNHQPANGAWSMMERPGFMRLRTASVVDNLNEARNSLTQRIFSYSPEGTAASTYLDSYLDSYGTIKMDISQMKEGDVAGLAVFQNPYSFIAVKMENGKKRIFSQRCTFNNHQHAVVETKYGDEVTADVIYLRAVVNFGVENNNNNPNNCRYFYSYDNMQWIQAGVEMKMGYTLDYFVGQRFYLFNFATQELGGYVDIDWFSTEPEYTEEMFYAPGTLKTYTEDDLTMESLTCDVTKVTMLTGSSKSLHIIATSKSGLEQDVASACKYQISNPEVATVKNGNIITQIDGECDITATYTDLMGNTKSIDVHVASSTFPLTADCFNPSIYEKGTFNERTGQLITGTYGFGGWQYSAGVDLSAFNYLVVKFKASVPSGSVFKLYDQNNYWSDPYECSIGRVRKTKIDLQNMKNKNDVKIDPSHIYIAGFWTYGSSSNAIYIDQVFLSMDGENPVSIEAVAAEAEGSVVATEIYSADGCLLTRPEKGINIIRTTYSDGKVEVKKILLR